MVRLDPQYRLTFGAGGQLDCTPDREEMERQIGALAPNDAPGFGRFLDENRRKLALMQPCLENAFSGWKSVLNTRLLKLLPMLRPHQSIDSYLRRFFADERIRLAFSFQSKYLGMSPFRCPSLFSILSFLEYEYGVFHPIGGCGAITAALARVARRLGVEIQLDEPVEEVLMEGRRATGVRTNRGVYEADAVVLNADFARAMTRLFPDEKLKRWNERKMATKKFSCSTFMLYLGIEGRYDLPHHNIYVSADYARNLDEIENRHVLSRDPSFYIQNASVTDPTLAPDGHEHDLSARAGDASAPECRLGERARRLSRARAAAGGKGRLSPIWKSAFASSACSRLTTGISSTRSISARLLISRTVCRSCFICGRITGSKMSTAFTWSAAERIRAAGCRSSSSRRGSARGCCCEDLRDRAIAGRAAGDGGSGGVKEKIEAARAAQRRMGGASAETPARFRPAFPARSGRGSRRRSRSWPPRLTNARWRRNWSPKSSRCSMPAASWKSRRAGFCARNISGVAGGRFGCAGVPSPSSGNLSAWS